MIWCVFLALQLAFFSSITGFNIALQRGIMVLSIYLFLFYVNWFFLVPRFYIPKRYNLYFLLGIALIILASGFRVAFEQHYKIVPLIAQYQEIAPHFLVRNIVLSTSLSFFVVVISFLIRIAEFYNIQERQKELLLQQKTEAELMLLKAQLNPHFLFNALNNIYALVLTRAEGAANALMSLSQLLRYIIYDAAEDKVLLDKEILYLKYYIELETLRVPDKEVINLDIEAGSDQLEIMPLVFIPFVENSFKHGEIKKGGFINISLKLRDNELEFVCENKLSEKEKVVHTTGGVGLVNSRKRLNLFYPERHKLTIDKNDDVYKLVLKIEL